MRKHRLAVGVSGRTSFRQPDIDKRDRKFPGWVGNDLPTKLPMSQPVLGTWKPQMAAVARPPWCSHSMGQITPHISPLPFVLPSTPVNLLRLLPIQPRGLNADCNRDLRESCCSSSSSHGSGEIIDGRGALNPGSPARRIQARTTITNG